MAKLDEVEQNLNALFDAERRVRTLHGQIADKDPTVVMNAAEKATRRTGTSRSVFLALYWVSS